MKLAFRNKLTPSWILFTLLLFILVVGLACALPTSSNIAGTQAALDLQATELALKATQLAQDAAQQQMQQEPKVTPSQGNDELALQTTLVAQQATLDAAIATQTAISLQQTNIAAGGTGNTGSNTTTPQLPTETITFQALPGFSNFTDNFNDPASGWPVQSSGTSQWWYANDHYYISVGSSNTQAVVTPGYNLADGYVMATGTITQDQPHAYYGVVCRFQDVNNYYFFEIGFDGYYHIGKMWDGQWSLIGMGAAKYSNAVKINDYNQITGHCKSNELSLYVNDIFVETVYDNTFTSGQIGLSASTGDFPGMTAAFDYIIAEE